MDQVFNMFPILFSNTLRYIPILVLYFFHFRLCNDPKSLQHHFIIINSLTVLPTTTFDDEFAPHFQITLLLSPFTFIIKIQAKSTRREKSTTLCLLLPPFTFFPLFGLRPLQYIILLSCISKSLLIVTLNSQHSKL